MQVPIMPIKEIKGRKEIEAVLAFFLLLANFFYFFNAGRVVAT